MRLVPVVGFTFFVVILSLVMTYPLVTEFSNSVLGPPGDNFEYAYKLWWFEHALLEEGRSPFFVPNVFYPFGYEIALSETTLANTILAVPLTAAFGEIIAYNVLVVWSFVLSALGAYLLARALTRATGAAILAGLIFAFLPYRLSHVAAGHLPLLGTGWLPLLLLYEDRLLRHWRTRDGALAGIFYALVALSSWYYAYMGVLVAVLFALLRGRPWRIMLGNRKLWKAVGVAGGIAVALMLPALVPFLSLSARGEIARTTLSLRYVDQWSASLPDFFLPSIMHPLWGERLVHVYPQNVHENLLFLGLLPIGLGTYALARRRGQPTIGVIAGLGSCAFLLALGTTLHWAGEPVYIPVPAGVEAAFSRFMYAICGKYALNSATYSSLQRAGHLVIPLPTLFFYLYLPFFSAMRVWARFGLVVGLCTALLAAYGAAFILRWTRWTKYSRVAVIGVLLAGILFEFATVPYPFGLSRIGPQPVDEWLRRQPGDFAVLLLPPDKAWHGPPLYAARVHGKKIAYGYGTYMPKAYRAWQERVSAFPDGDSITAIKEAGIRYILVGLRSYGDQEQAMRQKLAADKRLHLVYTVEEQPVFRGDRLLAQVRPSPAVPPTELVGAVRYAYLVDEIAVYEIVDK